MTDATQADLFVLGLLDDGAAARAEAALATDPVWARAVAEARDRFLPLDLAAPTLPLAPDLWDRVAAHMDGRIAARKDMRTARGAANMPGAPLLRRVLPAGLAAAIALAVGLAAGHLTRPEPVVIAILMDEGGAPRAVVEDYGSAAARVRFVSDVDVPEGRQMQVWTLPSVERGPVSLGLLATDAAEALDPPSLPVPAQGQLYEITLEPLGGSPTGRPTGAILAKGYAAAQT